METITGNKFTTADVVGTLKTSTPKTTPRVTGVKLDIDSSRLYRALERLYTQQVLNLGRAACTDASYACHCGELAEALTTTDKHFGVLMHEGNFSFCFILEKV